ncbi:MAG TPA: LacI family DNA-binding transcriptional regulator [Chloroflexota bacterium]|nr:LacI family DNA-binding transcriptional regulator [Chloroflexota bacterium]
MLSIRLRDLARQVGVHPSTVSRVLSGDPTARLSQTTRARILQLAAATGYRPNRLARSLKIQRTQILGMLIPDITNPVFSVLFRAVEDAAGAAGYNVILCNTDDSPARLGQHLRMLGEGHVDGLLLATAHRDDPFIDELRDRGMPYVLLNRRRDASEDCWVVPDDRQGARLAVAHLVALGHRRIAHLAGAGDISTTATRLAGFRDAMAEHGLAVDETLISEAGLTEAAGERGMARLLTLPADRLPTAIFVANDFAALGAVAAARAAGLRVPDDLSVVGYDDIPPVGWIEPALTTVRVPLKPMGRLATEILIQRLGGSLAPAEQPVQVTLSVDLVVRRSSAPPPTAEPSFKPRTRVSQPETLGSLTSTVERSTPR